MILFRGSISIGEYYYSSEMVLGPAIDDAAEWHAFADWAGISLTPGASFGCDLLLEKKWTEEKLHRFLIPHEIPFNDGKKRLHYAVNWPEIYFISKNLEMDEKNIRKFRRFVLGKYYQVQIGKDIESKYVNTTEFMDEVLAEDEEEDNEELMTFNPY